MPYSHIFGSEGRLPKKADLGSFCIPAFFILKISWKLLVFIDYKTPDVGCASRTWVRYIVGFGSMERCAMRTLRCWFCLSYLEKKHGA